MESPHLHSLSDLSPFVGIQSFLLGRSLSHGCWIQSGICSIFKKQNNGGNEETVCGN